MTMERVCAQSISAYSNFNWFRSAQLRQFVVVIEQPQYYGFHKYTQCIRMKLLYQAKIEILLMNKYCLAH